MVAPRAEFTVSVARSTPGFVGAKVTVIVQSVVLSERFVVQLAGVLTTKSALPVMMNGEVAAGASPTAKCTTNVWVDGTP